MPEGRLVKARQETIFPPFGLAVLRAVMLVEGAVDICIEIQKAASASRLSPAHGDSFWHRAITNPIEFKCFVTSFCRAEAASRVPYSDKFNFPIMSAFSSASVLSSLGISMNMSDWTGA